MADQYMARPKNTLARRAQIVAGLRRVMAERGYERATIGLIARAARLTPGLVHYHFGSKQEVLLALVEDLTGRAQARIEARSAGAGEAPRDRLIAFLDALLATGPDARPEDVACWALVASEAIRQPEVRAVYGKWIREGTKRLAGIIGECRAAEGRPRTGARAMAAGLMAAVEGYFAIAAAVPGVVPAGSAARTVRRMATGLLSAPREERR